VEKEFKQDEGDPHIKHQRRALHEEMLHEAAIEHVPKSNVVVVNPTHLAIAMKYDEKTMQAPQVTAKGQNRMAQTIIQIAKENKVPIMRNVPLAHSLFELEVGRDIPEDLYEAVAEVLNWVYQLSQQE
jgi:flagellar biosynthesis protein FlhB